MSSARVRPRPKAILDFLNRSAPRPSWSCCLSPSPSWPPVRRWLRPRRRCGRCPVDRVRVHRGLLPLDEPRLRGLRGAPFWKLEPVMLLITLIVVLIVGPPSWSWSCSRVTSPDTSATPWGWVPPP
ncbi:hypothetical protein QJS66_00550 [Kocuria rhizophila]|nr:hypothetical protein QJS66_00550 [Kocuria rhizophila]